MPLLPSTLSPATTTKKADQEYCTSSNNSLSTDNKKLNYFLIKAIKLSQISSSMNKTIMEMMATTSISLMKQKNENEQKYEQHKLKARLVVSLLQQELEGYENTKGGKNQRDLPLHYLEQHNNNTLIVENIVEYQNNNIKHKHKHKHEHGHEHGHEHNTNNNDNNNDNNNELSNINSNNKNNNSEYNKGFVLFGEEYNDIREKELEEHNYHDHNHKYKNHYKSSSIAKEEEHVKESQHEEFNEKYGPSTEVLSDSSELICQVKNHRDVGNSGTSSEDTPCLKISVVMYNELIIENKKSKGKKNRKSKRNSSSRNSKLGNNLNSGEQQEGASSGQFLGLGAILNPNANVSTNSNNKIISEDSRSRSRSRSLSELDDDEEYNQEKMSNSGSISKFPSSTNRFQHRPSSKCIPPEQIVYESKPITLKLDKFMKYPSKVHKLNIDFSNPEANEKSRIHAKSSMNRESRQGVIELEFAFLPEVEFSLNFSNLSIKTAHFSQWYWLYFRRINGESRKCKREQSQNVGSSENFEHEEQNDILQKCFRLDLAGWEEFRHLETYNKYESPEHVNEGGNGTKPPSELLKKKPRKKQVEWHMPLPNESDKIEFWIIAGGVNDDKNCLASELSTNELSRLIEQQRQRSEKEYNTKSKENSFQKPQNNFMTDTPSAATATTHTNSAFMISDISGINLKNLMNQNYDEIFDESKETITIKKILLIKKVKGEKEKKKGNMKDGGLGKLSMIGKGDSSVIGHEKQEQLELSFDLRIKCESPLTSSFKEQEEQQESENYESEEFYENQKVEHNIDSVKEEMHEQELNNNENNKNNKTTTITNNNVSLITPGINILAPPSN